MLDTAAAVRWGEARFSAHLCLPASRQHGGISGSLCAETTGVINGKLTALSRRMASRCRTVLLYVRGSFVRGVGVLSTFAILRFAFHAKSFELYRRTLLFLPAIKLCDHAKPSSAPLPDYLEFYFTGQFER